MSENERMKREAQVAWARVAAMERAGYARLSIEEAAAEAAFWEREAELASMATT